MKRVAGFGPTLLLAIGLAAALPGLARAQTTVTFPDPNLEAAVRAQLGKPTGDITTTDMLSLEGLPASGRGISNLEGLEYATNLLHLDLSGNAVTDAGPLAGLTALQSLVLDNNPLTSGAPLAGLTNLTLLSAYYAQIADTSWLTGLTQLQELDLIGNPLHSGTALTHLNNLTELEVNDTGISDLHWASGLHNLVKLGAGENGVTDASPLAHLTGLQFLGLGGSPLTTCAPLSGLTNLTTLYLYEDALTDVSCLATLNQLTWLTLADNDLTDVSPLASLTALQYVDLSGNPLASCAPLASLTHLTGLALGYDELTDVSCLSGLTSLTNLDLGNNRVSDASSLAGLTGLEDLDLTNNLLVNLDFVHGMTALTTLDVGNNQLTDINGLLGASHLTSADLLSNPLDLSSGSPAANVILTLQGNGVQVQYTGQIGGGGGPPPGTYSPINATYNGLFYVGDSVTWSNSGSIMLTTTSRGRYSGHLRMSLGNYSFSGSLSTNGTATNNIRRGRLDALTVNLIFADTNNLAGTIAASQEDWSADIAAYRAIYDGRANVAPETGRYTLALAGGGSPDLPAGNGFGTIMVNPAGKLNFTGSLADGTRVSQSATVSANGQWPLFVPLYAGKGSVLSWIGFTNNQTLGGPLAWTKPAGPGKRFTAGFAWMPQATGERYTPPGRGTNVLGSTGNSVTLTLNGGDLKQELVTQFTLNAKNQLKDLPSTNHLALSFTPTTGLFRGHAVDPDTHKGVSFNGVMLQNESNGFGYFLGTTNSGQVTLSQ